MHLVGARVGVWVRDQLDNHLLCFLQTLILGMCLKLPTFRQTILPVLDEDGSPPGLPVGTLPQRTRDVDLPFVSWHTLPCFLIHKSNLRTCVAGTKSVLLGRGAVAGGVTHRLIFWDLSCIFGAKLWLRSPTETTLPSAERRCCAREFAIRANIRYTNIKIKIWSERVRSERFD